MLPVQGTWVQLLVRELRPYMLSNAIKNINKIKLEEKKCSLLNTNCMQTMVFYVREVEVEG